MSRYFSDIQTDKDDESIMEIVSSYLNREGFTLVDYEGRATWKKGHGLMVSPQFITLDVSDGKVHIEAWLRFALLPGVYVGEMGTSGVFAVIPKRKLKERVLELERLLGKRDSPLDSRQS